MISPSKSTFLTSVVLIIRSGRTGRPDRAVQLLEKGAPLFGPRQAQESKIILELARDPRGWLALGERRLVAGETVSGQQAYRQAEELGASQVDLVVSRSAALIQRGEWEEVKSLLLEGLANHPSAPRLHNNMGVVAREQKDYDKALEYFHQAALLAPEWSLPAKNLSDMRGL